MHLFSLPYGYSLCLVYKRYLNGIPIENELTVFAMVPDARNFLSLR